MKKIVYFILIMCFSLFSITALTACNEGEKNPIPTPPIEENLDTSLSITSYNYLNDGANIDIVPTLNKNTITGLKLANVDVASTCFVIADSKLTIKGSYLDTLSVDEQLFTLVTSKNSVAFKVIIAVRAGVPSIDIPTFLVDVSTGSDYGVKMIIDLNNGELDWVSLNEVDIPLEAVVFNETEKSITISDLYINSLFEANGAGDYIFSIKTTGGSCNFTLSLSNKNLVYSGENIIVCTRGQDIVLTISRFGNSVSKLMINKVALNENDFTFVENTLTIKKEYFAIKKDGVFELYIENEFGKSVGITILLGIDKNEYLGVDFDLHNAPESIWFGYNKDKESNKVETVTLDGSNALKLTNGYGFGSGNLYLMVAGGGCIPMNFVAGNKYTLSLDIKISAVPEGRTCVLYGKTSKDIFELWTDGLVMKNDFNGSYTLVKDDIYNLSVDFTYEAGELEVFFFSARTSAIIDNISLTPKVNTYEGKTLSSNIKKTDANVSIGGLTNLLIFNVSIDGVVVENTFENGVLTLDKALFANLEIGASKEVVINTNKGVALWTITAVDSIPTLEADSFVYNNNDIVININPDGLTFESITLAGKVLIKDTDYTINGNVITIKSLYISEYLVGIRSGLIKFTNAVTIGFKIENKNYEVFIDWDTKLASDYQNVYFNLDLNEQKMTATEIENGIDNKSINLVNTESGKTENNIFYAENIFTKGNTYTVMYDFKLTSKTDATYLILNYGQGANFDKYIKFDSSAVGGFSIHNEKPDGSSTLTYNEVTKVYTMSITFVAGEAQQFKVVAWTAVDMIIDNFAIINKGVIA